ncbi:MAG: hypothetical protein WC915_06265 [archaeon]|jgi:hypothetical protein
MKKPKRVEKNTCKKPVTKKTVLTPKAREIILRRQIIEQLIKAKVSDYGKIIEKIPTHMVPELSKDISKFGFIDNKLMGSPHKFEELIQQLFARQLRLKIQARKK